MSVPAGGSTGRKNPDDLNRDVYIFLNLVATRLSSDVERLCREENLTEAHYRILWVLCLADAADGMTMGDIVDGLVNKASDVTRLVDKLEHQGLVKRSPSKDDRRRMIVKLTPAGRRVFARLTPRIKNLHVAQMAGLTEKDKRSLASLLNAALWGYSRD